VKIDLILLICLYHFPIGDFPSDREQEELRNIMWQSAITIITDLIVASGASGLILGLDTLLTGP